jgi:LYR motif-containing protein 4
MPTPTRRQVLSLYQQLLKAGKQFHDFNFRSYALRRTHERFHQARNASPEEAERFYNRGLQELEVVKRQATLNKMFARGRSFADL